MKMEEDYKFPPQFHGVMVRMEFETFVKALETEHIQVFSRSIMTYKDEFITHGKATSAYYIPCYGYVVFKLTA